MTMRTRWLGDTTFLDGLEFTFILRRRSKHGVGQENKSVFT